MRRRTSAAAFRGWQRDQRGPGAWRSRWNPSKQRSARSFRPRVTNRAAESTHDEAEPAERGPFYRTDELARVEAVLYLAKEPMPSRKIAQLAGLADGTAARTLVRRLGAILDRSACAFGVEEVAGGFQLMTRPMFGSWLRKMLTTPVEARLSVPALETLAVIAYRQPVLRADIEAIRGVQCGDILRQLMDRDLVKIVGRADELGRPLKYGTTKRFLQSFGLRHLDELPRAETLRSMEVPAEKRIDLSAGNSQSKPFLETSQSEDEEDSK